MGDSSPRAGVVGVGAIGRGVAQCVARSGRPVAIFDARVEATVGIAGATVCASAAEVASVSDVVLVAVVDAEQLRDVLFEGDGALIRTARPGCVVAILSTVAVEVIHDVARALATVGVDVLDVGVSGNPGSADAGELVAFVGGESQVVERARPVLDEFTRLVAHIGPSGSGMAAKIARNLMTYGSWWVIDEAATLAARAGVELDVLAAAVAASDPDGTTGLLALRRRAGRPEDPGPRWWEASERMAMLMHKDLRAAQDLADELGLELPSVAATLAAVPQLFETPSGRSR